jgi:C-terminal processing protease CtpA/Prc
VHVGDCVISVNGSFMLDLDYAGVVKAISKAGKKISLVLGSPEQMFEKDDVDS